MIRHPIAICGAVTETLLLTGHLFETVLQLFMRMSNVFLQRGLALIASKDVNCTHY